MNGKIGIREDGSLELKKPIALPEILDVLVAGGGPGGTATAFRARELGLSSLVLDFDDILKRIRDYPKEKDILPNFGGGDAMRFPKAGDLFNLLHFSPIDKDEMVALWKGHYHENSIPAKVGIELTGLNRRGDIWEARTWNHNNKREETYLARHIVIAIGRGVPRRFDIPGNTEGIAYRLDDPRAYLHAPACVIGGGTSAAEAVIAISNTKIKARDETPVYWSYRGANMPRVSKALADVFFDAYIGHGNIRYYPNSEPTAVIVANDRQEYLSIRVDRKEIPGRPHESSYLEFPKANCIACIGEDVPEPFLTSIGIEMVTGGSKGKKRMVVSPLFESRQPNVYLVGAILAPVYFVAEDFNANPATFREEKHRDNIKAAMIDGAYVAEVIAQKLAGKSRISVALDFLEVDPGQEGNARVGATEKSPVATTRQVLPKEGTEPHYAAGEPLAYLVRVLPGGVDGEEFGLRRDGVTTIGRNGADIAFPEDTTISGQHASILHGPDGFRLRDDGGATGIYVRAAEGKAVPVGVGSLVRAGRQFLVFRRQGNQYSFLHYDSAGRQVGEHKLQKKAMFVGRDAPDIVLDESDKTLSRRHFSIAIKSGQIILKDLKSINGTYLKVGDARKLENEDEFRIGQQLFSFRYRPAENGQDFYKTGKTQSMISEPRFEDAPVEQDVEPEAAHVASRAEEPAVTFRNLGITLPVKNGQTICELAEENGIEMDAECHSGLCGTDPIRIISGKEYLNEIDDDEEATLEDCGLTPGKCRMACMARVTGPVVVELVGHSG